MGNCKEYNEKYFTEELIDNLNERHWEVKFKSEQPEEFIMNKYWNISIKKQKGTLMKWIRMDL